MRLVSWQAFTYDSDTAKLSYVATCGYARVRTCRAAPGARVDARVRTCRASTRWGYVVLAYCGGNGRPSRVIRDPSRAASGRAARRAPQGGAAGKIFSCHAHPRPKIVTVTETPRHMDRAHWVQAGSCLCCRAAALTHFQKSSRGLWISRAKALPGGLASCFERQRVSSSRPQGGSASAASSPPKTHLNK